MREVVRLVAERPDRVVLVPHNAHRGLLNRALQSLKRDVPVRANKAGTMWGLPGGVGVMRTDAAGKSTLAFGTASYVMDVDQAITVTTCDSPVLPEDAVMVLKNQNKKRARPGEASACNGDVGTLVRAHPKALVRLDGGVTEFPCVDGWLTLAYAATVHKFQGSECEEVVLPVCEPGMWDRQLLYTAVTRAKARVLFVGRPADLRSIVARQRPERRSVMGKLLGHPLPV
jgi:hypothetical protein